MVLLRGEEKFMNFRIQEKLMLWMSRSKKKSFSTQEAGRKMIFSYYLRNLHSSRNEEEDASVLHKKNKKKRWGDIFFSMEYHVYWQLKGSCFE